jgi:hypothetical protein
VKVGAGNVSQISLVKGWRLINPPKGRVWGSGGVASIRLKAIAAMTGKNGVY